jgi:AcrR family transcriptional regulator
MASKGQATERAASERHRAQRRPDALSKERIVEAATEILDAEGEGALTFRALTTRLSTGSGAIYWHVANKDELLAAATDEVIGRALTGAAAGATPRETVRAVALGVYDAIDAHPWVGTQLSREPWSSAMMRVLEGIGGQLQALGVPGRAQFDTATTLLGYILGLAAQHAAAARLVLPRGTSRTAFLAGVAERWARLDPAEYPFTHAMAAQLPGHDDREQFLAGVDLILAGIAATES